MISNHTLFSFFNDYIGIVIVLTQCHLWYVPAPVACVGIKW